MRRGWSLLCTTRNGLGLWSCQSGQLGILPGRGARRSALHAANPGRTHANPPLAGAGLAWRAIGGHGSPPSEAHASARSYTTTNHYSTHGVSGAARMDAADDDVAAADAAPPALLLVHPRQRGAEDREEALRLAESLTGASGQEYRYSNSRHARYGEGQEAEEDSVLTNTVVG